MVYVLYQMSRKDGKNTCLDGGNWSQSMLGLNWDDDASGVTKANSTRARSTGFTLTDGAKDDRV